MREGGGSGFQEEGNSERRFEPQHSLMVDFFLLELPSRL